MATSTQTSRLIRGSGRALNVRTDSSVYVPKILESHMRLGCPLRLLPLLSSGMYYTAIVQPNFGGNFVSAI